MVKLAAFAVLLACLALLPSAQSGDVEEYSALISISQPWVSHVYIDKVVFIGGVQTFGQSNYPRHLASCRILAKKLSDSEKKEYLNLSYHYPFQIKSAPEQDFNEIYSGKFNWNGRFEQEIQLESGTYLGYVACTDGELAAESVQFAFRTKTTLDGIIEIASFTIVGLALAVIVLASLGAFFTRNNQK